MGQVPINVSLQGLDREALVRILKEPKSALIKQYQKLFDLDDVKLSFEEDAVKAIAKLAFERKTGARGTSLHHGKGYDGCDVPDSVG